MESEADFARIHGKLVVSVYLKAKKDLCAWLEVDALFDLEMLEMMIAGTLSYIEKSKRPEDLPARKQSLCRDLPQVKALLCRKDVPESVAYYLCHLLFLARWIQEEA